MTKQEFISKWNVAFESKEQELEFAREMKRDLEEVIKEGYREPKYTIECKVCGKPFGDKLSLYEHYNEEHN